MPAPVFVLEEDAPPVVRGVATTLKRAASNPKLARRLSRMKGVLALRSPSDPQSVTVRFGRGRVELSRGVAKDAGLVVTLDFNNAAGPDAPKPKVKGIARHPLLALGVASVLEPPVGDWRREAAAFWEFARDEPRMPASLRVVCTDDGGEEHFGLPGPPEYEIHGPARNLQSVFSGSSILGEDFLAGRVFAVGSFEHASVLTGRSIAWVMGEGR